MARCGCRGAADGPQGSQGAQGATGPQGTQGSQGVQGSQGSAGAQGSQGAQGAGAQGSQGSQGTPGAQGPQGSQGSSGAGSQGAQGAQGAQGPQGTQGVQGAQGTQGSQGATGSGSQGAQGAQGATGGGGGGLLSRYAVDISSSTTGTLAASAPYTLVSGSTITLPASATARIVAFFGSIGFQPPGAGGQRRWNVVVDSGSTSVSTPTNLGGTPDNDSGQITTALAGLVTVPGDSASHTIALACIPQATTASTTINTGKIVYDVYDGTPSTASPVVL